jgi:hypothetical protein
MLLFFMIFLPRSYEWSGIPTQGDLLAHLPGIFPSGCFARGATGVRSHYGCGAVGEWFHTELHPSSSLPFGYIHVGRRGDLGDIFRFQPESWINFEPVYAQKKSVCAEAANGLFVFKVR